MKYANSTQDSKLKGKSTFKNPHTLLFYTQSIFSTVHLHTVKSNHNVSLLCRVGDAGSGLPSCRTGFIWQKVDREGLHAGRSSRPLWDVILLHNMSATISECRFIFIYLLLFFCVMPDRNWKDKCHGLHLKSTPHCCVRMTGHYISTW